jgi:hypothetical protein
MIAKRMDVGRNGLPDRNIVIYSKAELCSGDVALWSSSKTAKRPA